MDNNNVREMIDELNKLDEDNDRYAWEIIDEDDILDPWRNEKKIQEGIEAVDWSSIVPCDIVFCDTSVQHFGEVPKRRPLLVAYRSASEHSPIVYGMQITSKGPGDGFRNSLRYKLQDWKVIGLRRESYVNYDHFVHNESDDVRKYGGVSITSRDAKGLLEDIKKNYEHLIKLGYNSPKDKEMLDDFISYLEHI